MNILLVLEKAIPEPIFYFLMTISFGLFLFFILCCIVGFFFILVDIANWALSNFIKKPNVGKGTITKNMTALCPHCRCGLKFGVTDQGKVTYFEKSHG